MRARLPVSEVNPVPPTAQGCTAEIIYHITVANFLLVTMSLSLELSRVADILQTTFPNATS